MPKFSDKSNPNQPTHGPSIYRHPKKDEKHHVLQSASEALQLNVGISKSSDFQGSTVFHVPVPLYLPRQVPHSAVTKSYYHTTPNANLLSIT